MTFHYLDPTSCRVTLQLDYDPQGMLENAGSALGFMGRRIQGDLDRFKKFSESRQQATGAWRGEVEDHPHANPQ